MSTSTATNTSNEIFLTAICNTLPVQSNLYKSWLFLMWYYIHMSFFCNTLHRYKGSLGRRKPTICSKCFRGHVCSVISVRIRISVGFSLGLYISNTIMNQFTVDNIICTPHLAYISLAWFEPISDGHYRPENMFALVIHYSVYSHSDRQVNYIWYVCLVWLIWQTTYHI